VSYLQIVGAAAPKSSLRSALAHFSLPREGDRGTDDGALRKVGSWDRTALLAFSVLQTWLIFTHEPWFDEVHALLIAREPWGNLFPALKYEGHPSLWYLFLGSVDRVIGPSPLTLPSAQLIVALLVLSLIWLRAPFPWGAKLLLSTSYYLLFEYGVISRSYGLGTLLALGAVALRTSIWSWLCLALLANIAAPFTLVAVVLGTLLFIEQRSWSGAAILAAGCFAAVMTVYPLPPDLYLSPLRMSVALRLLRTTAELAAAVVPSIPNVPYSYGVYLPMLLGFHLGLAVPILGALALRDRWLTAGFLAVYVGLVVLGTFVTQLSPRHVGVLFMFLVAALWLQREQKGEALRAWAWAWLVVMAACGLPYMATSHMQPFTQSSEIAAWVRAHNLADEIFGALPGRAGALLTSQIGLPTINVPKGCINTYIRFNHDHWDVADPLKRIQASGARYVISEIELLEGEKLVTFVKRGGLQPTVHIYRFDSNEPRQLPSCG
jgi:hypothetical protein